MCDCIGKLCNRFILSAAVTFTAPNLIINLPEGSYGRGCKYCLVIAQAIPDDTTITAPVVITIGEGTTQYPLTNRCGSQVTAAMLKTRYRYTATVATTPTGGSFRLCGNIGCPVNNNLAALTADVTAAEGGG